jgi:hypothetical protein
MSAESGNYQVAFTATISSGLSRARLGRMKCPVSIPQSKIERQTMADRIERRRYNLQISKDLYEDIERISIELDTSVVEVIKRFLRFGLIVYDLQRSPDVDLLISEKGEVTKVRFVWG